MQSVKLPDLPIPTCAASAVKINDHIYVCGGLCGGVDLARQVQVYDVNHNVWSTLPHSPQYHSQGVAINSKLVLIGGLEAASDRVTNIPTRQWWRPANLQLPRPMFRMQCTVSSAHLCVASASISYDVATGTSTTVKNVWQLPVTAHALEKVLFPGDDDTPHQGTKVAPTSTSSQRYYKTQLIL